MIKIFGEIEFYNTIYLLDRITVWLQGLLWFLGVAIHNAYRDECTPDFNCCCKVGRRCFIRLPDIYYLTMSATHKQKNET